MCIDALGACLHMFLANMIFETCLSRSVLCKIGKSGSEGKNLVSILIIEGKLPVMYTLKRSPRDELSENHSYLFLIIQWEIVCFMAF